jgi:hypothetical protein
VLVRAAEPVRFNEEDLEHITKDRLRLLNIQRDLELATRALDLLWQQLQVHHHLEIPVPGEGKSQVEMRAWAQATTDISLDIELYLRQVYELLYAIKVLAESVDDRVLRPAEAVHEELRRVCIYRDSLVVHKDRIERPYGGRTYNINQAEEMRLGVVLKPISEPDAERLQGIFARARPGLPAERRDEVNWNEQLQLLYENWVAVVPADRGQAKAMMKRNGLQSDLPITLTTVILRLSETYLI